MTGFVDVHSHVIPSGDDGARSVEAGLALCLEAGRRGTRVLYGTPHVWPSLPLTPERERAVRAAHAEMAPLLAGHGLDLRLGWELTPSDRLLEQDPGRYRLGELDFVLMEVPFHGSLALAERLGEHIEGSGLTPIVAHPERAEGVREEMESVASFRERSDEAPEYLAANSPEIAEFSDPDATRGERGNMLQSDLEMIRVYEDLIDILISKRIVVLTDFPTKAQEKLVRRKRLRSSLSSLTDVLAPEDDDGEEEALP